MGSLAVSPLVTVRDSVMSFWPLFLLSVRALNSHAGPLLDEYELVDLGDLPQSSLNSFSDSLPNKIFPFRVKRDLSRQQIPGGDIYRRYGQQASTLSSAGREQLPRSDTYLTPEGLQFYPEYARQGQEGSHQFQRKGGYGHQRRPPVKKKRKTLQFAFPFLSLKFKKFGIEFSEYQ